MLNEKVDIVVAGRRLTVEMEGLTPIEINSLAQKVSAKMAEIHDQNPKIADTSKIATLAALAFAAEFEKVRSAHETDNRVVEHKVSEMTLALQKALSTAGPAPKPG